MIIDKSSQFASAVALSTAGTGIANHGDVIDQQALGGATGTGNLRDIGRGQPGLYLVVLITTTVTSGGSATVQFILGSDSQQPLRTDGTSENIHVQTVAIPKATLVAGYEIILAVPLQPPSYARYLGLQINVGTAALTA